MKTPRFVNTAPSTATAITAYPAMRVEDSSLVWLVSLQILSIKPWPYGQLISKIHLVSFCFIKETGKHEGKQRAKKTETSANLPLQHFSADCYYISREAQIQLLHFMCWPWREDINASGSSQSTLDKAIVEAWLLLSIIVSSPSVF